MICREGDAAGPIYVICSGSVRAYRRSLTVRDSIQELALLGVGDVVGELAPTLQRLRSATVQALERTGVLVIPADQLVTLVQQHQSLLRVIALALRDRAGLTEDQIHLLSARVGLKLPLDVLANDYPYKPENQPARSFPVPAHDRAIAYPKALTCPSARLGDTTAAIRWFGEALRHPAIKDHANWEHMLREQWLKTRANVDASV